jgi:signal transduction histidine kinase
MIDFLRRGFGSVRVRITVVATVVFAIASTVGAIAIVTTVRHSLTKHVQRAGVSTAGELAQQLQTTNDPNHLYVVQNDGSGFTVTDLETGRVLGGSALPPPGQKLSGEPPTGGAIGQGSIDNGEQIVTYKAVSAGGKRLLVSVTSPLDGVRRSVDTVASTLWAGIPLLVAGVGLLIWFLVGRALRPVESIRTEVEDITHTTMHRRVPEPASTDEVARLARTMNSMLDRLEAAAAQQRRFVSDASHELRSPITAMRADLEVALRDTSETDWEALAQRALGETDRLARLVDDLLELARLDEGATRPYDAVDIDELVLHDVAARANGIALHADDVSAGRVEGDRRQLAQIVRNLLDNATRHARSHVALGVREEDGTVVLTVDDDGDGIADADRTRVFERFARLDEGRARDAGGAGLGLAVVDRVVAAHGGTVRVLTSPLGGARFEVRLPVHQGIETPPLGRSIWPVTKLAAPDTR